MSVFTTISRQDEEPAEGSTDAPATGGDTPTTPAGDDTTPTTPTTA